MKSIKNIFPFLFFAAFLFAAGCKKDVKVPTDALAYVPGSSSMVTAIHVKNLMQKADFESVKQMDFYQEMIAETAGNDPEISSILLNPEASGIDLDQKMYLATDIDQENPELMVTYLFCTLKNAEDFGRFFQKETNAIQEENGIKIIGGNSNNLLAWNNELAIFAFSNSSQIELPEQVRALFKADPAAGIAQNADLRKAIDGDHDITSWMSTDQLAENDAAGMALNLIDVDQDALKGNYIHSYGNFEKGRITGRSDFFINKDLGEGFIGRFFKKEVKADFTDIIPAEGLTFAAAGAMDLRGIDQFLSERPQTKDYADFVLNDMGLKRKDMLEIFGGDMVVAAYQGSDVLNNPKMLVATDLKSTKKAQQLIDLAEKQGKLKKIEAGYYKIVSIGNEDFSITRSRGMGRILMKNEKLIFSTNIDLLDKIKNGNFEKTGKDTWQDMNNQTLSVWMDFDKAGDMLGAPKGDWFKEMKLKVNAKGADFVLQTNDANTNSLHTIFQMINETYKQQKANGGEKAL